MTATLDGAHNAAGPRPTGSFGAPANAVGGMDSPEPKKLFTDPKLVVYGDIQQITLSVGMVGALDAAGLGGKKGAKVKTR